MRSVVSPANLCTSSFSGDRVSDFRKNLGIHLRRQDLGIDQHAVAVEDDEHGAPLSGFRPAARVTAGIPFARSLVCAMDLPYSPRCQGADGDMRLRGHNDDELDVSLSIDELVLMKNVLHEVCNGMDFTEADFQAIFGASRREVEIAPHARNGCARPPAPCAGMIGKGRALAGACRPRSGPLVCAALR